MNRQRDTHKPTMDRKRSGKPFHKEKEPSKPREMFTNHDNPLEDKIMEKVQSNITETKRKIENIERRIRTSLLEKSTERNGDIEELKNKLSKLEILSKHAMDMLRKIQTQFPKTHDAAVRQELTKQNKSMLKYKKLVSAIEMETLECTNNMNQTQSTFIQMTHILSGECSVTEFEAWKTSFDNQMDKRYPKGYGNPRGPCNSYS